MSRHLAQVGAVVHGLGGPDSQSPVVGSPVRQGVPLVGAESNPPDRQEVQTLISTSFLEPRHLKNKFMPVGFFVHTITRSKNLY